MPCYGSPPRPNRPSPSGEDAETVARRPRVRIVVVAAGAPRPAPGPARAAGLAVRYSYFGAGFAAAAAASAPAQTGRRGFPSGRRRPAGAERRSRPAPCARNAGPGAPCRRGAPATSCPGTAPSVPWRIPAPRRGEQHSLDAVFAVAQHRVLDGLLAHAGLVHGDAHRRYRATRRSSSSSWSEKLALRSSTISRVHATSPTSSTTQATQSRCAGRCRSRCRPDPPRTPRDRRGPPPGLPRRDPDRSPRSCAAAPRTATTAQRRGYAVELLGRALAVRVVDLVHPGVLAVLRPDPPVSWQMRR